MCFIDLQKAYHTVDRTILWQVLTRIGVPPHMIVVIRQFRDGMRACVRPDDGVCSDWLVVEEELRQGCALSPLLLNIFFAAVLNVVLQRFNEDPAILAELVHHRMTRMTGPDCTVVMCNMTNIHTYMHTNIHTYILGRINASGIE